MTEQYRRLVLSEGRLQLFGDWSVRGLHEVEEELDRVNWPQSGDLAIDGSRIDRIDTAGAWILCRIGAILDDRGVNASISALSPQAQELVELVRTASANKADIQPDSEQPSRLEGWGRRAVDTGESALDILAFAGEVFARLATTLIRPSLLRAKELAEGIYYAGVTALPITGLMSFLIGVVIAYQGGLLLRLYGAEIFVVDMVCLSMVRELSPLLTAIIVAGRTGSAYTAQIGTMVVTEEVDALRTIGIPPMDILVLPRVLALVIALPLLTVFCNLLGVFGGMLMSNLYLDLSFTTFIQRIPEAMDAKHLFLGLIKTPVFAAIIAIIGCYQGFNVRGGAESVGQHTTRAVVQSIFMVIVADAAFSVLFSWLDI